MISDYLTYREYLDRLFPGIRVQKISVDSGRSCPNRDGSIGYGGCIYCDNRSFTPEYCRTIPSIAQQIDTGKNFFRKKYPDTKYLAYFQSYTNTYGDPDSVMAGFREALSEPDVIGLIVGTRPDCMPDSILCQLDEINNTSTVIVEYGAETSHDNTLNLINRGHTWSQTVDAVQRTAEKGISCGLHLIAGLPGESNEDILSTIDKASALPIDTLKIHQLQVLHGTSLSRMIKKGDIKVHEYTVDEYIELCYNIIQRVPRHIAIERFVSQAPADMLESPRWGLKNYQFTNLLHSRLKK